MGSRDFLPTCSFALVVCQHPDGKFLLVDESRGRGWWLPGGGVESGESFEEAAIREAKEEAGIDIELKGILRFENSPSERMGRFRVIFYAVPKDPKQKPKSVPDDESNGAQWVTLEDLQGIAKTRPGLRGSEPAEWFTYLSRGGQVYPMQALAHETDPVPVPGLKMQS